MPRWLLVMRLLALICQYGDEEVETYFGKRDAVLGTLSVVFVVGNSLLELSGDFAG